jgi:hypothetical protein
MLIPDTRLLSAVHDHGGNYREQVATIAIRLGSAVPPVRPWPFWTVSRPIYLLRDKSM